MVLPLLRAQTQPLFHHVLNAPRWNSFARVPRLLIADHPALQPLSEGELARGAAGYHQKKVHVQYITAVRSIAEVITFNSLLSDGQLDTQ